MVITLKVGIYGHFLLKREGKVGIYPLILVDFSSKVGNINFSFKNKEKMGFWWHGPEKYAILLRNRPPGWHLQHFCFTWNIVLLHLQQLVFNIIKLNFNIIKICCNYNSCGKLCGKSGKLFIKLFSKNF